MKKTFVHSEFGVVPPTVAAVSETTGVCASGGNAQEVKALWIAVQAEKNEEKQFQIICDGLHPVFLAQCPSSKALLYRQTFGDGRSLGSILCRQLCRVARVALRSGFPANVPTAMALHDDARHMSLVNLLSLICDPSFFEGIVEQGNYESLLDVLALHNIPSILAALHASFLDLVSTSIAGKPVGDVISAHVAAVEQKHLSLIQTIVSQPHSAALIKDLHNSNSVMAIFQTFPTCLRRPFWASSSISALAADIVRQLLRPAGRNIVFPTRKMVDASEQVIIDALYADAEDDGEEFGDVTTNNQKLVSLSHCVGLLLALRRTFGVPEQETLDYGVIVTVMLSLQHAMGQQRRTAEQVIDDLLAFSALPPRTDQAAPKEAEQSLKKPASSSFLSSYLPTQLTKMLAIAPAAVAVDHAGEPAKVAYPAALESAATFLVCAVNADAKMILATRLFAVLLKKCASDDGVAVRTFCIASEHVAKMDVGLLSILLRAVDELARNVDASSVLRVLASQLQLDPLLPEHVEKLLNFFANLSQAGGATAKHVVGSGVIERSSALLERINSDSDLLVNDTLVASIKGLWFAVLGVPGSVETFELCESPRVCLQTLTAARADSRVVAATAHARSMFVALVSTNNEFIECLVAVLLQFSGRTMWDPRTSDLLATFATVVFEARCHEEAVRKNAIEVMLSLLQSVEFSASCDIDINLICTGLALILPVVRWSEVGRMLSVAIPVSLKGTVSMCQGLVDLCTGYCRDDENLSHIYQFLSAVDDDRQNIKLTRMRPRTVGDSIMLPSQPFVAENVFPLLELCSWLNATPTSRGPAVSSTVLVAVIAALADSVGTAVKDIGFATFVADKRQLDLLRYVADVSPISDRFVGGLVAPKNRQEAEGSIKMLQDRVELWNRALEPRRSLPHFIEFPGCGGAFGHVDVLGSSDGWPSSEGYSAAVWVHWKRGRNAASKCTIPLWSLSWVSTDPSASMCRISLKIDLARQFTVVQVVFNGQEGSVELPLINPGCWTHVVVSHQRNKLFPSELTLYLDGAVAKKSQLLYPMTAVTKAASLVPCRNVNCVIGFDGSGGAAADCSLRVGPFQLYNSSCNLASAMSMFAVPNQVVHTGQWGAAGQSIVPVTSLVLPRSSLAALAALSASDMLDMAIEEGIIKNALPPSFVLVSLHPQAALLVDAAFRYLDNKEWALTNLAQPATASSFLLQGMCSEPTGAVVDSANSLVARGATSEWLRWFETIERSIELGTAIEDIALAAAASGILPAIAAVSERVSVVELRQRPFFFALYSHIKRFPRLYINPRNASSVTLLFCTNVPADNSVLEGSSTTESFFSVLTNIAMAEMLLLNIELLANLDEATIVVFLKLLAQLLSPASRYHRLNAVRLKRAGFVSCFVYGLHREFLPLHLLVMAVDVVELFLRAMSDDQGAVRDVMTAIALSVPLQGDDAAVGTRLSSQLAVLAPSYIATVRNLLLRGVCNLLQSISGKRLEVLMSQLASAIPMAWIAIVMDRFSHPVTVIFSLQLVIFLLHQHAQFRFRSLKENMWRILCNGLQHFCHHTDIMSLLVHGFLGHIKNPNVYSSVLVDESLGPTEKMSPQLLHVVFHLLKVNVLSSRSVDELIKATDSLEVVPLTAYLSRIQRQVVRESTRRSQRAVSAAITAIRAVARMRRGSSTNALPSTIGSGNSSPLIVSRRRTLPSPLQLEEMCLQRRELASRVANWMSLVMTRFDIVVAAVYSEKDAVSCVDMVSWMVVCAIGNTDQEAAASYGGASPPRSLLSLPVAGGYVSGSDEEADDEFASGSILDESKNLMCLSCGLDDMLPVQFASLYQSCTNLYSTLIEYSLGTYQSLHIGSTKTSIFAQLLHRVLNTCPQGIGNQAEAWLCGKIIATWLSVISASLKRHALTNLSHSMLKNALSMAQYVADRLVSGLPCPPSATLQYVGLVASYVQSSHDLKHVKGLLADCMHFILGVHFHGNDPTRITIARDIALSASSTVMPLVLSASSSGPVRVMLLRLAMVTYHTLTDQDATQRPSSVRLGELWHSMAQTLKGSSVMTDAFVDSSSRPKLDFLHGGFDILYQRLGAVEMFLSWFADNRYSIHQFVAKQLDAGHVKPLSTHPKKHLKWTRKYQSEYAAEKAKIDAKVDESVADVSAVLVKLFSLETFVDSRLLASSDAARYLPTAVSEMVDEATEDVVVSHVSCGGSPVVHRRVFTSLAAANNRYVELGGQPVGAFIVAPPGFGAMLSADREVTSAASSSPTSRLKPEACELACRLALTDEVRPPDIVYAGNVYYLAGNESIVCAVLITKDEIVLISNGQFSPSGSFVIAPLRTHAAAAKQQSRRSQVQDALSRFLPVAPVQAVFNAESLATFRHSQYFRQLRTEAQSKELSAFVWRIPLATLLSIHQRRFQHHSAAVEFVSDHGAQAMLVVLDAELTMSKSERNKLVDALLPHLPSHVQYETNAMKKLKVAAAQKKWMRRQLSNFEYLTIVNDAASRSTADLSQYPVFPWVIGQFDELSLDLDDEANFRDLTKPIGAIRPQNAAQVKERFDEWPDDSQPPFHYGTHYSTSAIAMYYLVRLQPYTQLSVRYQGGRLDVADRLFHSVLEAWTSSICSASDVKELIPEFFTSAAFVRNVNKVALGTRRDGTTLNDVVLPPWSCGSPDVLVAALRDGIEREYVSANLSAWIDLVFGFKQRGDEAVKALNVFHHLSYDDGLEHAMAAATAEEDRKAIVASLDNFGLTPKLVFTTPHPRRLAVGEAPQSRLNQFLSSFAQLVRRPSPATSVQHGVTQYASQARIASLHVVDSVALASTRTHVFSQVKPIQCIVLDEFASTVSCMTRDQLSLVCVLPSIRALGVGSITCLCTSVLGHIVCCGTAQGFVVVFMRVPGPTLRFTVAQILHSVSLRASRLRTVQLWSDGRLACTSDGFHGVVVWHVAQDGARHCLNIPLEDDDQSPVRAVIRHESVAHIIVVCKERRIYVVSSATGSVLLTVPLPSADLSNASLSAAPFLVDTALDNIQCAAFVQSTYARTLAIVVGHRDGVVSCWTMTALPHSGSFDTMFTFELAATIAVESKVAVTAVLPQLDSLTVLVASASGSVVTLALPQSMQQGSAELLVPDMSS